MATIEEIDAEIARREKMSAIDEEIARREGTSIDAFIEPIQAIGGGLLNLIGSGLAGIGKAFETGNFEEAGRFVKQIQDQASKDLSPETEKGKKGLEIIMSSLAPIENLIKSGVAGTAGLVDIALQPSQILTGAEQARGTVRSIKEFGLGKSAGQQALEVTGSPAIAAAFETAPVLIEEIVGGLAGRALGQAKIASTTAKAEDSKRALDDLISGDKVKDSTVIDVATTIQKGDADDIAAIVDADPEFFRALDELNISSEPLASFSSRNSQFIDVEQALATVPGNILDPIAKTFIAEVSQTADNLIQQYGGTLDKAQLGLDFKADSLRNVESLFQQADDAYGSLRNLIPEQNRFPAPNAVSFLQDLELKDKLPPKLSSILNKIKPKSTKTKGRIIVDPATGARRDTGTTEIKNPTLGRIDLIRKEIGQAIGKGSGQFKDVETGLNKALYARLTKDQDAIAQSVGGEALAVSDIGKSLVKQRKQVEDNLQLLLGKDLNQALNINVSSAVKNLQKGEIDKFKQVINAIPKHKRGEVVLSAMNDVFKGTGVNQQSLNPTQFVKWFQTINRSPSAKKALFGALPDGSKVAIENLFEVSRGISRALGQKTPTGRINALFNNDTGFIRKMVGRAVPSAVAFATGSPTASVLASSATEQFLKQSSDGSKRASDLMGSAKFQNIIRQSVKEGVIEGKNASKSLREAEKKLMKTKIFQTWANDLGREDKAILQGGVLAYLFGQEQEQQ